MVLYRRILLASLLLVGTAEAYKRRRSTAISNPFPNQHQDRSNLCTLEKNVASGKILYHSYKSLSSTASALESLRGGSSEAVAEQSLVARTIQSLVHTLVSTANRISPSLAGLLRSLAKTFEAMFGVELLPIEIAKKPLKRRRKKAADTIEPAVGANKAVNKKKKRSRKTKKNVNVSKVKESEVKTESSIPEPLTKIKQQQKPVAQKSVATKSAGAKQHLLTDIKSSSPNYRIQRELKQFIQDPPPNLTVRVGKNIRIWIVTIVGAKGSIYEGETFQLRIQFPPQYPTVPPSVYFLPPHIPLHEHVYTNGDICLSLLGKDWRPTMTAQSIAVSIQSILNNALRKELPMDNAQHAHSKPGQFQKDWVYHDDNC
ncbi:hypothetical protein MPSEU_001044100 [Mayamaea pseudoterrestris]|nr:hypothetical protein MPSEU_001044100 [Mayamaea pseudoterrestris]